MEKEYAAAKRNTEAELKTLGVPIKESEHAEVGRKRKQSESGVGVGNINANSNFDDQSQRINGNASTIDTSPTAKKARTVSSTPTKKTSEAKKELEVHQNPSGKSSSNPKYDRGISRLLSPDLIDGLYDISCPRIKDEFSAVEMTLTLAVNGNSVWGAYDFDALSGILRLPERPWKASDDFLTFEWRDLDNGESMRDLDYACSGGLKFVGNGHIEGWISMEEDYHFYGTRRPEVGTEVWTAGSMRKEWEEYDRNQESEGDDEDENEEEGLYDQDIGEWEYMNARMEVEREIHEEEEEWKRSGEEGEYEEDDAWYECRIDAKIHEMRERGDED